jgi:methyltransferase (TIGR00027 family)
MTDRITVEPSSTAERCALWRALHVQVDDQPPVFDDELGLLLASPTDNWRERPEMAPEDNPFARAAVITRHRFGEDTVVEQAALGVRQYVLLGAGLDTFAQRRAEIASTMQIFEVDQAGPQEWKRRRLDALGLGVPHWLHLVPDELGSGDTWWEAAAAAGFDRAQPAVVASLGLSTYLGREATEATVRRAAQLAPGSTFVTTFQVPLEMIEPGPRELRARVEEAALASGTPFTSFFHPDELVALAREAGFRTVRHVTAAELTERYFSGRADGLRPSNAEELIVATT